MDARTMYVLGMAKNQLTSKAAKTSAFDYLTKAMSTDPTFGFLAGRTTPVTPEVLNTRKNQFVSMLNELGAAQQVDESFEE